MEQRILSLWFIRLRWFAFSGQLLILALAQGLFALTLPWVQIALVLLLIPIGNICARMRLFKSLSERHLVGSLLAMDTLILTVVLALAGGPTNPFTIVYLLHVVLAAVMLSPVWTWAIAVLSSCGFASLFLFSVPVPEWASHGAHHGFSLHLHGMLFAYVVVALLVTYFLNKIVRELQLKERKLHRLETIAANQQRLACLTTITANAAHELGTPLSTISVVSSELERTLGGRDRDADLLEDLAILKNETARCKKIIHELSEKTGDLIGELPQPVLVMDLVRDVIAQLHAESNVEFNDSGNVHLLRVPRKALSMALRALIKNALEAAMEEGEQIRIELRDKGSEVSLEIKDQGVGMDQETLERVGEPFFSTKGVDKGMGLGVYLSRLTIEQLGGKLVFKSVLGGGTSAIVTIPVDCALIKEAA